MTLHALVLSPRGALPQSRENQELELTIADGTKLTGGRRDELLTTMALGERLHVVLDEINNQYKVTYGRPKSLIPPTSLDVTSKRPDVTVRTRQAP